MSTETIRSGFLGLRSKTVDVQRAVVTSEEVVGPHWVLHQTWHNIESKERGIYTEYYEQKYWVLQKDGCLLKVWRWEEAKVFSSGTRVENDLTASAMTEDDILMLDRSFPPYEKGKHGSSFKCWGNREPQQIVRHAKGVGMSLALKALLEGRRQELVIPK
ncbi:hypothetical protein [Arthrobacter globiformis]|uniref:hypothetical protein n=1 Tax=Arthrobacter globiformis TaxID=1665 RepID=UPI0011B9477B|nr:hypothetical protein [Arthrobacter globiformis]